MLDGSDGWNRGSRLIDVQLGIPAGSLASIGTGWDTLVTYRDGARGPCQRYKR
jgi:hypothetical protein